MLPAVWILGTGVSTGVAYAAVQMVSGSVVESQREPLTSTFASAPTPAKPTIVASSPSPLSEPSPSPSAAPAGPPVVGAPPSRSPSPAPAPQPSPSSRTFALVGGTAQVSCSGDAAFLNWATPNSGFWVETSTENGGATTEVRFRSDTHESRLDAWCTSGNIQFTVREQSS